MVTNLINVGAFTIKLFHQFKSHVLAGVDAHSVNNKLLLRGEALEQALHTGNMVDGQQQTKLQITDLEQTYWP